MKKPIHIVRGAPASGKETVCKELVRNISGKVAYLELDTFRWYFHLFNRTPADVDDTEHQLAYKNYLAVLEQYLADGSYTIVTEGFFSPTTKSPHGFLPDVHALCEKYQTPYENILLHAEYDILWERNCAREYVVPKEEFDMLYHHVMNDEVAGELRLDVGILSPQQSVTAILNRSNSS